jgi:hypothetical protein
LSDLRDAQELRIHIPLEDKRLAYFEVQRIEHPNWAFKSTCVQFTGWEDEVDDKGLKTNFESLLANDVYYEAVEDAYPKAAAAHFTDIKKQTEVKRALEGCMGL